MRAEPHSQIKSTKWNGDDGGPFPHVTRTLWAEQTVPPEAVMETDQPMAVGCRKMGRE